MVCSVHPALIVFFGITTGHFGHNGPLKPKESVMKVKKGWGGLLVILVMSAMAALITVAEFFGWLEGTFPQSFPQGPVTQRATYEGTEYDFRYYAATSSYVGIAVGTEVVAVLAPFTNNEVETFGVLNDFVCDVKGCGDGGPSSAGTVVYANDGGITSATIVANYKGDKLWGVGADGKGYELPVNTIDALCAHSLRLGNWEKQSGPGCSKPEPNGTLRINNLPGNDCHRLTAWSVGKQYWFDTGTQTGYSVSGLNAKLNASCGVEYGPAGYTPAKVSAVREPDGTASLLWDFGSDFVGGFYKGSNAVVFDLADQTKVYAFVLNGSHAGKDYKDGWGLGEGRKTAQGDLIPPSTKMAWLQKVDGRFLVKFTGLDCADAVNITAYLGAGPADNVVYDYGPDGYGLGWGGLQSIDPLTGKPTQSFWTAGEGVTFDPKTGKASYGLPFCKK